VKVALQLPDRGFNRTPNFNKVHTGVQWGTDVWWKTAGKLGKRRDQKLAQLTSTELH